jgi:hypothetical protein
LQVNPGFVISLEGKDNEKAGGVKYRVRIQNEAFFGDEGARRQKLEKNIKIF